MTNNKNLLWFGPPYSYSGYALHNRAMIFELAKLGWSILLQPSETHIPPGLIGKENLIQLTKNTIQDPHNAICINLIPPPALGVFSKYTILFTTLESKTIHPGYLRRCMQYDEVWVPCKDNYKSFRDAGYPKKQLYYCPEGVHTGFWSPDVPPNKKYKSNEFTFFFCGDWSYRKGIDILIPAYAKAFESTENVRLLMLTHYQGNGPEKTKEVVLSELLEIMKNNNINKIAKIEFIFDHIPDDELPSVFACADVGVFPTRGEAWLLPAIQCMSMGKPVITTAYGGQTDYTNNKNGYLIDVDKFDTIHDKVNLTVDFYWDQLFPFPSQEHLTKLMRYCYSHPDEVKRKGKIARQDCQKYWTWENSGKVANRRLTQINERLKRG